MNLNLLRTLDEGPQAVATRGLEKRYGGRRALAGLDLAVPEGAVYVLVGPNGAGKTTTLKLLLDLVRPESGQAEVFGLPVGERGPEVRSLIGYVPDAHDFAYPELPVGHLLRHHQRYFPRWDPAYAEELCRRLEVAHGARLESLSKGQVRRVQLVQALAHRPPLLLFDEPTDGLDPLARDLVLGLIADHMAATPTTLLLSTHLVHEVEGLGDCLGVLRGGRLVAQLRRSELDRHLHRVAAEVPEGWPGAPRLEGAVLKRQDAPREILWTVWGEAEEIRAGLAEAGATVRATSALNLEDATRVLLAMEER